MSRRVFVTGGAGFIGGVTVRQLRERGDQVVAVLRDTETAKATALHELGVQLIEGDLSSVSSIHGAMAGCDAVIHCAGSYKVGIREADRPAMYDANVGATERVLDAAIGLSIDRIVAVSTVNVFGNTKGAIPDETYHRDLSAGFLHYYDETKYRAHQAAQARIDAGAPIVIAMPGGTYGRSDHSAVGAQLKDAFDGHLRFLALGSLGVSPTYVDDLATGIIAALDRGRPGESYVMAGENLRLHDALQIVARAGGRRLPRLTVPDRVLRVGARIAPNAGGLFGLSPNLTEILAGSIDVTYWANSTKAATELGYRSRDLATGALAAFGPA